MQLGYVLREAIKGLGRNVTMTIALVITSAISIGLIVSGVSVAQVTSDTKDIYLERVEVMVQLDEEISGNDTDCSSQECKELKEELEGDPGVDFVQFRSREDSYDRFVELFKETDPLLVEETGPDALPAALHVRLHNPADTSPIDKVRDKPQVADVVDQADEVRGATENLDAVRNATFLLAAVLTVAAVFLVANMVQIAAFNRRREMSIMRMVGASRWITHAPFVLEAVFAVLLGTALAAVGTALAKKFVLDPSLANLYQSQLIAPVDSSVLWLALPLVGLAAVVFAALTAQVTLRAYVRK